MSRQFVRVAIAVALNVALSVSATTCYVAQNNPLATDAGDGTKEQPWKTIGRATQHLAPGDIVEISDGVYREQVVVKANGTQRAPIVFQAVPGARVVMTGADALEGWKEVDKTRPVYSVGWTHRFIPWSRHMTHPDDEYHRLIGRCEQVMIDGYQLRQVLEAGQLAPGTFFVDVSNQVLKVWDMGSRDLNKVPAEASVRQEIFRVEGNFVQVRGFHFRHAANMAQHGAVVLAGDHDLLEDCISEQMNSSGATFSGKHLVIRRCVFRDNGQLGFGANGAHDLLFTDCLVENNNIKGFSRGWEAGGDKLVLCRHAVLERSRFLRNHGNGIWFDIGNEQCVVRQCLVAQNDDCGIFCEISFGMRAHDNIVFGNGFAETTGAWGAQAGISLSSSPDCVVERNLILRNREGFDFREQNRSTPRIDGQRDQPVWNHDEIIRQNIIAYNRDAQVWGWFDVSDGREWPSASNAAQLAEGKDTRGRSGEGTSNASGARRQSRGKLTLEKLRLSFLNNDYFAASGQGWFDWGVPWRRHKSFSNLHDFTAALGVDRDGMTIDPEFANLTALDFRIKPATMKRLEGCYPQGAVPEAVLGLVK